MPGAPNFEWDPIKDQSNRAKHGVSFSLAQRAFFDPQRVIAEDLSHSGTEARYFCFGLAGSGVMTVRFTWRAAHPDHRRRVLAERKEDL